MRGESGELGQARLGAWPVEVAAQAAARRPFFSRPKRLRDGAHAGRPSKPFSPALRALSPRGVVSPPEDASFSTEATSVLARAHHPRRLARRHDARRGDGNETTARLQYRQGPRPRRRGLPLDILLHHRPLGLRERAHLLPAGDGTTMVRRVLCRAWGPSPPSTVDGAGYSTWWEPSSSASSPSFSSWPSPSQSTRAPRRKSRCALPTYGCGWEDKSSLSLLRGTTITSSASSFSASWWPWRPASASGPFCATTSASPSRRCVSRAAFLCRAGWRWVSRISP